MLDAKRPRNTDAVAHAEQQLADFIADELVHQKLTVYLMIQMIIKNAMNLYCKHHQQLHPNHQPVLGAKRGGSLTAPKKLSPCSYGSTPCCTAITVTSSSPKLQNILKIALCGRQAPGVIRPALPQSRDAAKMRSAFPAPLSLQRLLLLPSVPFGQALYLNRMLHALHWTDIPLQVIRCARALCCRCKLAREVTRGVPASASLKLSAVTPACCTLPLHA
jgi:hypothetical protein